MIITSKDNFLKEVVDYSLASEDYVAVCVYEGGAFGEGWRQQLIQLQDSSFFYQDVNSRKELSDPHQVHLDIDFRKELNSLRTGQFKLRSMLNKNPDLKTGEEYIRIGTIFLVVGNEAEWIAFPRHISGGHYESNAINRLCAAFELASSNIGDCSFTLVEQEEAKPILETIEDWPMYFLRQGMELVDLALIYRQPIQAFVTEELAHDAQETGIQLQPFQQVEILSVSPKQGGSGLVEFLIQAAEGKKKIMVSPNYLQIRESEPLFSAIKAYQENLFNFRWISTLP